MTDCADVPVVNDSNELSVVKYCGQEALKKIYEEISPKTVKITHSAENGHIKSGSGFFVDDQNDILTNAHVVKGTNRPVTVTTVDGSEYPAYIKKLDDLHDLALLYVDGLTPDPSRAVRLSAKPYNPSEQVFTLGHPLGADKVHVSVGTFSNMSNIDSYIPMDQATLNKYPEPVSSEIKAFFQAPYAVFKSRTLHGDSGGPMVNDRGELEGVVSMSPFETETLAIPTDRVRTFLKPNEDKFRFSYGLETSCITGLRRPICRSEPVLKNITRLGTTGNNSRLPLFWNLK